MFHVFAVHMLGLVPTSLGLFIVAPVGFFLFKRLQHVVPPLVVGDVLRSVQVLAKVVMVSLTSKLLGIIEGCVVCHIEGAMHVVGFSMPLSVSTFLLGFSLVSTRVTEVVLDLIAPLQTI